MYDACKRQLHTFSFDTISDNVNEVLFLD